MENSMYIFTIRNERYELEAPNDTMARIRLAKDLGIEVRDLPEHELYKMDE